MFINKKKRDYDKFGLILLLSGKITSIQKLELITNILNLNVYISTIFKMFIVNFKAFLIAFGQSLSS